VTRLVLAAFERLQAHRATVFAAGVAVEAAVMAAIGTSGVKGVRGIGGESAVILAVFGALLGGPLIGCAMTLVGWAIFFPLVANDRPASIVALPIWLATTYAVGRVSAALVETQTTLLRRELDARAAHALRTPVATIHGMVQALRRHDLEPEQREKVLNLIENETGDLLESDALTLQGDG
jgi:signal transduction histidine kinase